MISRIVSLLPLFVVATVQAQTLTSKKITCTASGSVGGIVQTEIQNSDVSGQICAQTRLAPFPGEAPKLACSHSSISNAKIFLFGQFELGFATLEYFLEKSERGYSIAEYVKCDNYHGESGCRFDDEEFHFTGRDLNVTCTTE